MLDGSGLSPQNRVTTDAMVKVMQFARARPWFNSFYNALPVINGTRMKSGYIGGTKSYTGYIKNKVGNEYTFAIIVNNYDGSSPDITRKMWAILDILK
jgi:D-alanyl-D-alanine carboxypeptidase/D-alanyl-D-alanine-endopeptidase (penicillin-binding protein 4)